MPGLMDEVKKKINRPVSDLPLSDETEILVQRGPLVQRPQPGGVGQAGLRSRGHESERRRGAFSTGRPDLPQLRPRRRAQRRLLQMPELRGEFGMFVAFVQPVIRGLRVKAAEGRRSARTLARYLTTLEWREAFWSAPASSGAFGNSAPSSRRRKYQRRYSRSNIEEFVHMP